MTFCSLKHFCHLISSFFKKDKQGFLKRMTKYMLKEQSFKNQIKEYTDMYEPPENIFANIHHDNIKNLSRIAFCTLFLLKLVDLGQVAETDLLSTYSEFLYTYYEHYLTISGASGGGDC